MRSVCKIILPKCKLFAIIDNVEKDRGQLEETLKGANLRVTKTRVAVLKTLFKQNQPLTAKQVKQILPGRNDLATVYRTLSSLSSAGLAKPVNLQSGVVAFESAYLPHHHHLVCQRCGLVKDVFDCKVNEDLEKLAKENQFAVVASHVTNYLGLCQVCARG